MGVGVEFIWGSGAEMSGRTGGAEMPRGAEGREHCWSLLRERGLD